VKEKSAKTDSCNLSTGIIQLRVSQVQGNSNLICKTKAILQLNFIILCNKKFGKFKVDRQIDRPTEFKLVLIVTGTVTDVPQTSPHLVSGVIIVYVIDNTALLQ
jgi:hypothetical protein